MAVGLSQANFIAKVLNHMLQLTASTAPAGHFIQTHTGDPGAAGTSNTITGQTNRQSATYGANSAGTTSMTNTPTWTNWAGSGAPNTVSHITDWDASTAGNFLFSAALAASKSVATGDTFTLSSLTVSLAPAAA